MHFPALAPSRPSYLGRSLTHLVEAEYLPQVFTPFLEIFSGRLLLERPLGIGRGIAVGQVRHLQLWEVEADVEGAVAALLDILRGGDQPLAGVTSAHIRSRGRFCTPFRYPASRPVLQ